MRDKRTTQGAVRHRHFRAALKMAGLTAKQWAKMEGVTGSHVWRVIEGERTSPAILAKVDQLIDAQLGGLAKL